MITTNLSTEYIGLSTDTKPTMDVRNGSTFVEMDTRKLFAWDAQGKQWIEQAFAGGGNSGGGGSDDEETTVTIFDNDVELAYDSHDGFWDGNITPENVPDTTKAVTIEVNGGTYTTLPPDDYLEGGTAWEYDDKNDEGEWLQLTLYQGNYSYQSSAKFLPSSEEQSQTIPVKITQVQSSGGSGGGERMIVNFSTQDGTTYTVDKTYAEIKASSDANVEVVAKSYYPQTQAIIWVPILSASPNAITFVAQDVYSINNSTATVVLYRCVITKDDVVVVQQMTYNATVVSA